MNLYQIVERVKIKVGNEIKEFKAGKFIRLSELSARRLIEAGKIRHIPEPVPANNESEYENYFQTAIGRIAQDYQAGTIDYIRRKYPGRFQESLQIENRLNDFWDKDLQEFKKAVDDWQKTELELIKLFTQKTN